MLSFGRVRALIANRNEIGASRRADYIFFSYGLTIHNQKRKLAVTSQRRRFSSNGAELGPTRNASVLLREAGGATLKSDLDHFFGSGITAPKWSPPKICRGTLVMPIQKADLVQTC